MVIQVKELIREAESKVNNNTFYKPKYECCAQASNSKPLTTSHLYFPINQYSVFLLVFLARFL